MLDFNKYRLNIKKYIVVFEEEGVWCIIKINTIEQPPELFTETTKKEEHEKYGQLSKKKTE